MDRISKKDNVSVGLLIGFNCTKDLEPISIIPSCENGLHIAKKAWLVLL